MPRIWTILAVLLLAVAGCGGDDEQPRLRISAAASLKTALTSLDADAAYSFGGSDVLAAQIRSGARPDVYTAANAKLPRALFDEGLVERPVAFARNRLVVAVPAQDAEVAALDDLGDAGVRVAMGSATVPIGAYTREVLGRLPAARRRAILANVRSEEPDVAGIAGKVAAGAVEAGFVYASDVAASKGALSAIALPDTLQPEVVYEAAVVKATKNADAARAFLTRLTGADGRAALRRAGFLPPP